MFKKFKTTDKISFTFALVNLLSLIVLLLSINVIYFFLWYEDQKQESLYDMDINYDAYSKTFSKNNIEAFKSYILQKDTIIIPPEWELICSNGVSKKLHNDIAKLDEIKDSYFYKEDGKIYFIFSQYYEEIGEVKVLFDTTPYIKSQIIIIKISFIIILIFLFLSYFTWKLFSKYMLKDLRKISHEAQGINIDNFKKIECYWCQGDEIKILADTINSSFEKIQSQTQNLRQFITDVSHEFKTPLMIINSKIDVYYKMLEKNKSSKEDVEVLLESIKHNTKKLNNLLETLFLLSRKTEWIEEFEREEVDLWILLKSTIDSIIKGLIDKEITIKYKIRPGVIKCIDKVTFNIIIENLLTNSVKFSQNEAIIEVWLDESKFWVKDNWIWIEQKDLKNIWNKFYRADTKREWFWVWLFIIKRIIDLYKWSIKVESETWKGTQFTITF